MAERWASESCANAGVHSTNRRQPQDHDRKDFMFPSLLWVECGQSAAVAAAALTAAPGVARAAKMAATGLSSEAVLFQLLVVAAVYRSATIALAGAQIGRVAGRRA